MKKRNMGWICLLIAGLTEIIWPYFMKRSYGFTKLVPTLLAVVFIVLGFIFLERAVRVFGIGMTYAIFTGIGIVGTSIIGVVALHESVSVGKVVSILILLIGLVGLKCCDREGETS